MGGISGFFILFFLLGGGEIQLGGRCLLHGEGGGGAMAMAQGSIITDLDSTLEKQPRSDLIKLYSTFLFHVKFNIIYIYKYLFCNHSYGHII